MLGVGATTHMWTLEDNGWGGGRSLLSPSTLWLWGANPSVGLASERLLLLSRLTSSSVTLMFMSSAGESWLLLPLSAVDVYSVHLWSYRFYYFTFHPASLSLHLNALFCICECYLSVFSRRVSCCLQICLPFICKKTSSFSILWQKKKGVYLRRFAEPTWPGTMFPLKTHPKSVWRFHSNGQSWHTMR